MRGDFEMTCRDFERLWQEELDACEEAAGAEARQRALEAHAARCPSCRALARGYQALRQALGAWRPPPVPSDDFTARVLASAVTTPAAGSWGSRVGRIVRGRAVWAVAAGLLLAVGLGLGGRWAWDRDRLNLADRDLVPTEVELVRSLTDSLSEVTEATWELAFEASAPAARVGRSVLASASWSSEPVAATAPEAPTWPSVGDRVEAGVRPLATSARQAFGFLIGPALEGPEASESTSEPGPVIDDV